MQKRKKQRAAANFSLFVFHFYLFLLPLTASRSASRRVTLATNGTQESTFARKKLKYILVFCSLIRTFAPEITKK